MQLDAGPASGFVKVAVSPDFVACMAVAGPLAEGRYRGVEFGEAGAIESCFSPLDYAHWLEHGQDFALASMSCAAHIIKHNWGLIARMAIALDAHGELDKQHLCELGSASLPHEHIDCVNALHNWPLRTGQFEQANKQE